MHSIDIYLYYEPMIFCQSTPSNSILHSHMISITYITYNYVQSRYHTSHSIESRIWDASASGRWTIAKRSIKKSNKLNIIIRNLHYRVCDCVWGRCGAIEGALSIYVFSVCCIHPFFIYFTASISQRNDSFQPSFYPLDNFTYTKKPNDEWLFVLAEWLFLWSWCLCDCRIVENVLLSWENLVHIDWHEFFSEWIEKHQLGESESNYWERKEKKNLAKLIQLESLEDRPTSPTSKKKEKIGRKEKVSLCLVMWKCLSNPKWLTRACTWCWCRNAAIMRMKSNNHYSERPILFNGILRE